MPSFFRACRQKRSFSHPVSNKPSKVQQIIAELIRFNTDSSHMKWQNFLTLHRIRFFRYLCLCLKRRWQISFWNIGTSSFEWLWLCPLRHPPCPLRHPASSTPQHGALPCSQSALPWTPCTWLKIIEITWTRNSHQQHERTKSATVITSRYLKSSKLVLKLLFPWTSFRDHF